MMQMSYAHVTIAFEIFKSTKCYGKKSSLSEFS